MVVRTPYDDITGTGAIQSLAAALGIESQPCSWYQVTFVSNASGQSGRIGDATISATRGIPFGGATSIAQFLPQNTAEVIENYDLANVYVIIPAGDTISVAFGI